MTQQKRLGHVLNAPTFLFYRHDPICLSLFMVHRCENLAKIDSYYEWQLMEGENNPGKPLEKAMDTLSLVTSRTHEVTKICYWLLTIKYRHSSIMAVYRCILEPCVTFAFTTELKFWNLFYVRAIIPLISFPSPY